MLPYISICFTSLSFAQLFSIRPRNVNENSRMLSTNIFPNVQLDLMNGFCSRFKYRCCFLRDGDSILCRHVCDLFSTKTDSLLRCVPFRFKKKPSFRKISPPLTC